MNRQPDPADHQNHSLQKFLEIYEKLLNDSRAFVTKMALPGQRKKRKKSGRVS